MLACTRARLTPPPPNRADIQASTRERPSPAGTASSRRVPVRPPLRLSGSAASSLALEETHLAWQGRTVRRRRSAEKVAAIAGAVAAAIGLARRGGIGEH